jgi:hypothetical protein
MLTLHTVSKISQFVHFWKEHWLIFPVEQYQDHHSSFSHHLNWYFSNSKRKKIKLPCVQGKYLHSTQVSFMHSVSKWYTENCFKIRKILNSCWTSPDQNRGIFWINIKTFEDCLPNIGLKGSVSFSIITPPAWCASSMTISLNWSNTKKNWLKFTNLYCILQVD